MSKTQRGLFTFAGQPKRLEDCSRAELIELIEWMQRDRVRAGANLVAMAERGRGR